VDKRVIYGRTELEFKSFDRDFINSRLLLGLQDHEEFKEICDKNKWDMDYIMGYAITYKDKPKAGNKSKMIREVAEYFDVTVEQLMGRQSIHENVDDYEIINPHNRLEEIENNIDNSIIYKALETLSERERMVIKLRFGLHDGRPKTLSEVAKVYDVTRERVRQVEQKALKKLRHPSITNKLRTML